MRVLSSRREASGFSVTQSGMGALLHVRLKANGGLIAKRDAIIGLSGTVETNYALEHSGFAEPVSRSLAGAPVILHKISASAGAESDVILAPQFAGEIGVLNITAGSSYRIRPNAFVACSPSVSMKTRMGRGLGASVDFYPLTMEVSGVGQVAITARESSVYRVALKDGEEYSVRPRHLLAWSASMNPTPDSNSVSVSETRIDPATPFFQYFGLWMLNRAKTIWTKSWKRTKGWALGDTNVFYRLSGPGEIFLQSRVQTSNNKLWRNIVRQQSSEKP